MSYYFEPQHPDNATLVIGDMGGFITTLSFKQATLKLFNDGGGQVCAAHFTPPHLASPRLASPRVGCNPALLSFQSQHAS